MTELEQYLDTYMSVPAEDKKSLVSWFHPTSLDKGDYFLKAGRTCEKLSFQRSGLLRIYADHGEKEITQWISYKGTLITDISGLVCNQPSRYNFRALTHCEFYTIDKKDYDRLPSLIESWPSLERKLLARCFGFIESRIFSLLSMSAEERYNFLFQLNPELFNEVPLKYLASMMGMTPESLSRIRSSFSK